MENEAGYMQCILKFHFAAFLIRPFSEFLEIATVYCNVETFRF